MDLNGVGKQREKEGFAGKEKRERERKNCKKLRFLSVKTFRNSKDFSIVGEFCVKSQGKKAEGQRIGKSALFGYISLSPSISIFKFSILI